MTIMLSRLSLLVLLVGVAPVAAAAVANVDELLHALEADHELRFRPCDDMTVDVSLCATNVDVAAVQASVLSLLPDVAAGAGWSEGKKTSRLSFTLSRRDVTLTLNTKKRRMVVEFSPALLDCGNDPRLPHVDEHEGQPGFVAAARIKEIGDHPEFPERPRLERVRGAIKALATIDTEGRVTDLCVLQLNRRGMGFEAAFFSAIREWRYRPATLDGEKVAIPTTLTTTWDIH